MGTKSQDYTQCSGTKTTTPTSQSLPAAGISAADEHDMPRYDMAPPSMYASSRWRYTAREGNAGVAGVVLQVHQAEPADKLPKLPIHWDVTP